MKHPAIYLLIACAAFFLLLPGCHQWFLDSADREVVALIESRQQAALGFTADASIESASAERLGTSTLYSFVPSPIDSEVPEAFRKGADEEQEDATTPSRETQPSDTVDDAAETPQMDGETERQPFSFSDALGYAMSNARRYQTEKELLYLTALDLTLERYLWTPRFVESVLSLEHVNLGQVSDFDRAMTAVSRFAVEQRLPYGGEVTARVINTLVRDVRFGTTTGESGQLILETRLPLLRGAGPVAYESRYQAERNLIYAVRDFERFRREFLVNIASDYFGLLSLKARIASARAQARSLAEDYRRDQALADAERILPIDADRTRVSKLRAQNDVINAVERYETSLDFFKIRIGMPIETPIDTVEQELDLADPQVPITVAIETALKYRLDLLNTRDFVDDTRRGVTIARNSLSSRVDLSGSVTLDTDPNRPDLLGYNTERTTWRAGVDVEIPLDRKRERNDYRRSLIQVRRSQRDYEEATDSVRLEVRRAVRRLVQTRASLEIQDEQIRINEVRAEMARVKFEAGELPSNRDVVEAEDDLRDARNRYADALSDYRRAVLEFLRDTGTLRIADNGMWVRYDETTGEPIEQAPSASTDAGEGG
ncbi:MAG: TolC family protein [Planctomycetes bacterium]|nr:TolC family protein [Planctomycetota bacterium]